MFAEIAPRYDLLNHLLSFNIDRGWRKALLKRVMPILLRPDARVLDLCCGTGDVLLDLQSVAASKVLGADFCHPMLVTAAGKARARGFSQRLFEADALELPLACNSLDAITIAFGFRNLANYRAGSGRISAGSETGRRAGDSRVFASAWRVCCALLMAFTRRRFFR